MTSTTVIGDSVTRGSPRAVRPRPETARIPPSIRGYALCLLLLATPTHASAATVSTPPLDAPFIEAETHRVMLLHGVWVPGPWHQAFQAELSRLLAEDDFHHFEVSQQLLGIYGGETSDSQAHVARYVEAAVRERGIDQLVCTQQAACRFLMDLDVPEAQRILVGPGPDTVQAHEGTPGVQIVASGGGEAIAATLEHIRRLRPGTRLHVFVGTSDNDREYLELALSTNEASQAPMPIEVVSASTEDRLDAAVAELDPDTETGLMLTREAWGDPPRRFAPGAMSRFQASATAPVFVSWDAAIGGGIVGGAVTSARAYAQRTAERVLAHAHGEAPRSGAQATTPIEAVYDAGAVRRWKLDLGRLDGPVRLVNEQPSLWDTNRAAVLTAIAVAVLLLSAIVFLLSVLQATRRRTVERVRRAKEEADRRTRESEREKMEALGALAASVAHDFNNLLAVIVGIADLLNDPDTTDAERTELLSQLEQSADRATRLVRQILTFSRQSRGIAARVDLRELLTRTLAQERNRLPEDVSLQVDAGDSAVEVLGDAQRLEQIVANLVANAADALVDRGGKITARLRRRTVDAPTKCRVGALDAGAWAEILIGDDGPGMTRDETARIFEPFYTSKALGTGIGLATVQAVVEEHGGAIELTTEPGQGTEFMILIPIRREASVDPDASTAAPADHA